MDFETVIPQIIFSKGDQWEYYRFYVYVYLGRYLFILRPGSDLFPHSN